MTALDGKPPRPEPSARTRRVLRVLAFAVVPGLFIALLVVGLVRTQTPKVRQGALAPEFRALALLGGGTMSSDDLLGVPVVFNFWASWCDPCIAEAPDFESTFKQYQARGVRVIGVDYRDTDVDAARFIKENGVTYPILRDPEGTLAAQFGVTGVPETFFVDTQYRFFAIGEGKSQGTGVGGTNIRGAVPKRELVSQIQALLAFTPPPARGPSPSQGSDPVVPTGTSPLIPGPAASPSG